VSLTRTDVVGIFPDRDALVRLVSAVLVEQHSARAASSVFHVRRRLPLAPPLSAVINSRSASG
jgi:transposase-like protein